MRRPHISLPLSSIKWLIIGARYASVFPLPVSAASTVLLPLSKGPAASACKHSQLLLPIMEAAVGTKIAAKHLLLLHEGTLIGGTQESWQLMALLVPVLWKALHIQQIPDFRSQRSEIPTEYTLCLPRKLLLPPVHNAFLRSEMACLKLPQDFLLMTRMTDESRWC